MAELDDDKVMGRIQGEQIEPEDDENIFVRLIYMLLIAIMI